MNTFWSLVLYFGIGGIFLAALHSTDSEKKHDIDAQVFVSAAWPAIVVAAIMGEGEDDNDH